MLSNENCLFMWKCGVGLVMLAPTCDEVDTVPWSTRVSSLRLADYLWVCLPRRGSVVWCFLVIFFFFLMHTMYRKGQWVSMVLWSPHVLLSWFWVCPASLQHKWLGISCLGSCKILNNGLEAFQCIFPLQQEWIPVPDLHVEFLLCCLLVMSRFGCFFSPHLVD